MKAIKLSASKVGAVAAAAMLLLGPAVQAESARPTDGGNAIPQTFIKLAKPVGKASASAVRAEYWTADCGSAACRESGLVSSSTRLLNAEGSQIPLNELGAFRKIEVKAVLCGSKNCEKIYEIQLADS